MKGYKILSLEAKDLFGAMIQEGKEDREYSIRTADGNLSLKKFKNAFKTENKTQISTDVYNAVESTTAKKAEFALDMIYNKDPQSIAIPAYIAEALEWLENEISLKDNNDFLNKEDE